MKTSFSEIIEVEKYLQGQMSPQRSLVFQAKLVVDEELRRNTFFQKMVHRIARLYHRRQLKAEVEAVSNKLFADKAKLHFRESIMKIFNP